MPTAILATDQTQPIAAPRIKLLSHGFSIDHPDPELGEQLMANALGVADRDAMDGILRQLVRVGQRERVARMSAAICGDGPSPGCRCAHPGYACYENTNSQWERTGMVEAFFKFATSVASRTPKSYLIEMRWQIFM